ncbi:FtsW/RodA/SpoVE family cell cycle protein [Rhodohalobacter sp. 8-1]|uniref:FtsW/RodA/SpoVE family cell cycle protein n=1 Tax=Rhodohalobacter sp. 8-1 TaxID=3131972 RepID=UPI0030ED8901
MGTAPEEMETKGRQSDRVLLVSVIILMMFGAMAVYSSIAYFAQSHNTTAGSLVTGHIIKLGIAFFVILVVSKIEYSTLAKFSKFGLIISCILLVAVMVMGDMVFGARRSLSVAGFSFQPSSLAAVTLIVHLAVLICRKQDYIKDFKTSFLPIMFWVLTTCFLIALEDFSTAALLMGICLCMMFVGRMSMVQLSAFVLIGLISGSALIMTSPERQSRVEQYVEQITDIKNESFESSAGYQAQQAHIAIAQGEIFGVGVGKSTQRDFLPAPYNDFIFAIIAEEYGMAGSFAIILVFCVILIRGIAKVARNARDLLGTLIALGATLMITLYGFVNAAVATGLFPVTGLPMPFVSYGGSSMLFTGVMVGLLLNISKHNLDNEKRFYVG